MSPVAFASNPAGVVIGTTPAEIHARFPGVIWRNLSMPKAALRLSRLSDFEMEKLAITYINASNGGPPLQGLIAKYAPSQLSRYQRAIALVLQRPVVGIYPPPVRPVRKAAAPTNFMTFDEIYMEFRTAQVGSWGAEIALYETARYAGGELTWAAGAGWAVGEAISYGMKEYCDACQMGVGAVANALWNYAPVSEVAPMLLVQSESGYGLGDFGVATDLISGAGSTAPPETFPSPYEAGVSGGAGFGLNSGFGFDTGTPGGNGSGGKKHHN